MYLLNMEIEVEIKVGIKSENCRCGMQITKRNCFCEANFIYRIGPELDIKYKHTYVMPKAPKAPKSPFG